MSTGARAYIGFGYETRKGVSGGISSWMPFTQETINPKYVRKPSPNINSRRSTNKSRIMQVNLGGSVKGAPDSESQLRLRGNHQGKSVVEVLDGPHNVYRHNFSQLYSGDPPESLYRETIHGIIYRDDGVPMHVSEGVVTNFDLTIKENEYLDMNHDLMFGNMTESRTPIAAVGNNAAFTGVVQVRGIRRDADLGADAPSVWVKVTRAGALDGTLPRPGVSFYVGSDPTTGPFGTAVFDVVNTAWIDVTDGGTPEVAMGLDDTLPFQVLFTTDTPADVLTVDDLWEVRPTIPVLSSPPYTAREVYDFGQAKARIDGRDYVWDSITVKGMNPKVENRGIGSRFAQGMLDSAEVAWTVEMLRKYTDRSVVSALRANKVVAFNVLMTGARIGTTAFKDSHEIILAACQYDEAATNVANENTLDEKVVVKAFDNRMDPICLERVTCTVPVS